MTRTDSMTKTNKLEIAKKALCVFFAAVLTLSLFPAGMEAFGDGEDVVISEEAAGTPIDEIEGTGESEAATTTTPDGGSEDSSADAGVADAALIEEEGEPEAHDYDANAYPPVSNASLIRVVSGADFLNESGEAYVDGGTLVFNDGGSHMIGIDAGLTLVANIQVSKGTKLTIKGIESTGGSGSVRGLGNESVVHVNGGTLETQGEVRIYGGIGSAVTAGGSDVAKPHHGRAGGGILVEGGGTLVMNGGIVGGSSAGESGNTAVTGGGIYIALNSNFTMNAGTVGYNKTVNGTNTGTGAALGAKEGGGIFFNGSSGTINGGHIVGNVTNTTYDWGGGGIFVNSGATLNFGAAATVRNNTANGLGGGMAGCPHAKLNVGNFDKGFAIYGNTAYKTTRPTNADLYKSYNGTGDIWAYAADTNLTADKAMDFYCVLNTNFYGQELVANSEGISYEGYVIEHNGTSITKSGKVSLNSGSWLRYGNASVGLTAASSPSVAVSPIVIEGNKSGTHGGGIGSNGTINMGSLPDNPTYDYQWTFDVNKSLVDVKGNETSLTGGEFSFGLYEDADCTKLVTTATNDKDGKVAFIVNDAAYASGSFNWYVKEIAGEGSYEYDEKAYPVSINVTQNKSASVNVGSSHYTSTATVTFPGQSGGITIKNKLKVDPIAWAPEATKEYYGNAGDASFSFTLQAIDEPVEGSAVVIASGEGALSVQGSASGFSGSTSAAVVFPQGAVKVSAPGDYWFMLTEDAPSEGISHDETAYAIKVTVKLVNAAGEDAAPYSKLAIGNVECYYLDSADAAFNASDIISEDGDSAAKFVNFDERSFGLYSRAVNAVTGQPVAEDQKCLVDPKIYKVLEGRTLQDGQFQFQLIQVNDEWNSVEDSSWGYVGKDGVEAAGYVVSVASNDQYGMVDFDAAYNRAEEGEDPCCLVFTKAGEYHFIVREVNDEDRDPSIDYSDDVITFTAVVEGGNGSPLVCTEMYYGKLIDGTNVRFSTELDPDYRDDATWHPTLTNTAKPMELQVRKTSESDPTEGLNGATYGLYMVSNGVAGADGDQQQGDIYLGKSTSSHDGDEAGWITFTDEDMESGSLNLELGNLYYFKEIEAPSQHTVSEFRSMYFYLDSADGSNDPESYVLRYTDSRYGASGYSAMAADEGAVTFAQSDEATPVEFVGDKMRFRYMANGGVRDAVTSLDVNKLDGRTHEWVEGAELTVIRKSDGEVMDTWTTSGASHQLAKKLDVETVYVLRETSAPEGYQKADDVEFMLDAYGNLEILSGTDDGNAEGENSTLTMYDFRFDAQRTNYKYNETEQFVDAERNGTAAGSLLQTGDSTPVVLGIALIAALAIAAVVLHRRRKNAK